MFTRFFVFHNFYLIEYSEYTEASSSPILSRGGLKVGLS